MPTRYLWQGTLLFYFLLDSYIFRCIICYSQIHFWIVLVNVMIEKFINQIIVDDCLKMLPQLPAESVDVAFADPPFNLKKKYGVYKDRKNTNEYLQWCRQWLLEIARVTKPTGSIFVHNIPKWLIYYAGILNEVSAFVDWIAWDAPTAPMGKRLQPAHYGILFYAKDKKQNKFHQIRYPHKRCRKCKYLLKDYGGKKNMLHPFGPLVSDMWCDLHRIRHKKQRDAHPCQLPIPLLERIILMSSDENDIILDPFIGTGTTAVAAKRLGRKYIGIELDPQYVQIAEDKLIQHADPSKIGDVWVSLYRGEIATLCDKDWERIKPHFIIPKDSKQIDSEKISRYKK